ncbi:methylthioribose kinase-like isoform X2 [Littorina saxatilis]|uniref:methylthioribose kinase-like isoform X2 n=1 Tax=Littorina saxatilis TaxID=31220 RepID=UPI0038B60758
MAESWVPCNWKNDKVLELAVLSFLQNCPFSQILHEDRGPPTAEDLDVCRCVTSFTNDVIRIRIKHQDDAGFILKIAPDSKKDDMTELLLPPERGQMEFEALTYFNTLVPGCAPCPLFYDKFNKILCMRELSDHQPLSGAVLSGQFSDIGARALGTALASLHAVTHTLTVGTDRLQELSQQFRARDSMMTLLRTYHFERPFDPSDSGRRCHPSVLRMLPEVFGDAAVMKAKEEVKRSFMNDLECLVHGDLHIESVLVNGSDIKIIDAEFTRVGPCAYDLGLLLATLLIVFHRYRHVVLVPQRPDLYNSQHTDDIADPDHIVKASDTVNVASTQSDTKDSCVSGGEKNGHGKLIKKGKKCQDVPKTQGDGGRENCFAEAVDCRDGNADENTADSHQVFNIEESLKTEDSDQGSGRRKPDANDADSGNHGSSNHDNLAAPDTDEAKVELEDQTDVRADDIIRKCSVLW